MGAALDQISADLTKIGRRPGIRVPEYLRGDVGYMREIFTRPGLVPVRYAAVLEEGNKLLGTVANGEVGDAAKAQDIVDDVASEFRIMRKASDRNENGDVQTVPVTAKVIKGGKELKGWEIFYMEYFLKHVRKEVGPDSFPRTSTSTYSLPPGRYLLESRDQHGGITEQKACTVDEGLSFPGITCELLVK